MTTAKKMMLDIISRLPDEKVMKILSFAKYIETETEPELIIFPEEEAEIERLVRTEERVDGDSVLKGILEE